MANYVPIPFVRPEYSPDTRSLRDLLMMASQTRQQSLLQQGAMQGQGRMQIGALIANALGSIQQDRQQKAALAAKNALEQQKLAQEATEKQRDFALRAAQFQQTAQDRAEQEARLGRVETKEAARDAIENTLPDLPMSAEAAQTLRAYPGTAPLVSDQMTLPARAVSPDQPPMGAPMPTGMAVRGRTTKETEQAAKDAQSAALAQAAALRQAAMDKRQALMDANLIRHQNVMENRPTSSAASPDGIGNVALSPDAIEEAAHRVRLFGPSSIPTRFNEGDKKRILNRSAEINKALGNSPAAAAQKQAAQKADQVALNQITKMGAAAAAFENKANAQADLVNELSPKVDRTAYPLINGWIVSGKAAMGDTPAHLLGNALLTFTNEYAKIMEGSTGSAAGSSESSRRDAAKLISAALSKGTLAATVDQMKREMRMTIDGYRTVSDDITERMGGTRATPTAPVVTGETWESDGKGGFRPVKKP